MDVRKADAGAGVKGRRYPWEIVTMPSDRVTSPSAEDALRVRVKAELRKRMRGLRGALPASACAERSGRIAARCLSLEPVASAQRVALFWPLVERREVDLRTLDATLRNRGVRIAYPAIDRETGSLHFRFVSDPESMVDEPTMGTGLREPSPAEPEAVPGEIDVIVVPALAVDSDGHRIGYGAGYYDRTLPRFGAAGATSLAVAFDFQLLAEIPSLGNDVRVDWVVTDTRVLHPRGSVPAPSLR